MNPSLIITPNSDKAGKLYSIVPTDGTGDLTVTRATTATFVGSNGLIQTAGNNVPRLDYTNGSCPSILVEPQRTNLLLRSEEFSLSVWHKTNGTLTANTVIAPNGTLTADTFTRTSNIGVLLQSVSQSAGVTYAYSIYLKGTTNGTVVLGTGSGSVYSTINITTNWQRYTFVRTALSTVNDGLSIYLTSSTLQSVDIWGAQLEVGSNATSYIPTTASAVTRNADVINKTGISSLIGQTEGTILFKTIVTNLSSSKGVFELNDGTSANIFALDIVGGSRQIQIITQKNNGGLNIRSTTSNSINLGVNNIAISYTTTGIVLAVNGVILTLNSTGINLPDGNMTRIDLGHRRSGNFFNDYINIGLIKKTTSTNSELIAMTTL